MGRGIVESGLFRQERVEIEIRTTDPSSPSIGEMWYRDDLDSGTDKFGELRWFDGSSVNGAPVYNTGVSGADVNEVWRLQTKDGVGFIPLASRTDATYQQISFQHGGNNLGLHDNFEVATSIPDSGVARWTFDDADTDSGTALDYWNNNDGTINGATTGVSGANQTYDTAEAYSFDGSDDYIALGDVYDSAANSLSFAGWFYVDSYDRDQTIFGTAESGVNFQHIFRVDNSGSLQFVHNYSGGDDIVSVAGPTVGSWAFGFCYYDHASGEIGVSIDAGTRSTQATSGAPIVATVDSWEISRQPSSSAQYWIGDLDDPRLYSKILSTTEESNLYNTGSISG